MRTRPARRAAVTAALAGASALALTSCALFGSGSAPGPSSTGDGPAGDGGSAAAGAPVEVTFIYSSADHDPIRFESGNLLSDYWTQLGITVTSEPMDFASLSTRLGSDRDSFNAFISGYVSRPERLDPDVLLYRPFHSSGVESGVNYQGWSNPAFDEVVEAQRTELDPDKRRELVFQAQEILNADLPAIPLYHVKEVHIYDKEALTDPVAMIGQGLWNFWTVTGTPVNGGDGFLRVGLEADIGTTNPFATTDGGNTEQTRLVYDMLARISPDGTAEPWAAESWTQVDPTTVEVKLRPGMTFHDGVPVTSEDVKFSFEVQQTGAPLISPFLGSIESIDATDDLTLVFHLSEPYPPLFAAAFSQVLILPKHLWETADPTNLGAFDNSAMIGSGPLKFDSWTPQESLRLVANKDHFAPPANEGLLNVFYATPDAIFAGIEAGDVSMADRRLLPAAIEQAKSNPDKYGVVEIPDFGVYYMGFNVTKPPFDDLAFRQAIARTVDFETIVDTILEGYAEPGASFIAPANASWYDPDVVPAQFDLDEARALLTDAGYTWDAQGKLHYPAS